MGFVCVWKEWGMGEEYPGATHGMGGPNGAYLPPSTRRQFNQLPRQMKPNGCN